MFDGSKDIVVYSSIISKLYKAFYLIIGLYLSHVDIILPFKSNTSGYLPESKLTPAKFSQIRRTYLHTLSHKYLIIST